MMPDEDWIVVNEQIERSKITRIKWKTYEQLMKSKIPSVLHDSIVKQIIESPHLFNRLSEFIILIENKIAQQNLEKVD